jgi:Tfp pilus assembly protein PilF
MYPGAKLRQSVPFLLGFVLASLGHAQQLPSLGTNGPAPNFPAINPNATNFPATNFPATNAPATNVPATNAPATNTPATNAPATNAPAMNAPPASGRPGQPPSDAVNLLLGQAFQLLEKKQLDAALQKVNAALQSAPQNPDAYDLRGTIYAEKKLWDQAGKDYQTALQLDGKNVQMKFNLAELEFMQKKYEVARPGFAALKQDPDMGDLATYKIFLCDLFGGHDDVAAKELDAFNQVGSNASFYFANAAWSLYHHKTEDARGWLMSATNIYAPNKFKLYATSLIDLGYMPLPPPQP